MLNFIKKLFGGTTTVESAPAPACCSEKEAPKGPEFHEEIRAQVEAEKAKPAKKPAAKKASAKAVAKKAPAKKTATKKSK